MSELSDTLRIQAQAALPPVEGEVSLSGLHHPVEVLRDRWGVPHIYAQDLHDLYFATSYVVTSERLFQQDFMLRLANGRLATMIADLALPLDRFFRTIGFPRAARRRVAQWDDLSHEIVQASLQGANAWIETMPAKPVEYEVLGLDPEPYPTGEEGAAYGAALGFFMDWTLSGNWDTELLRAGIAEAIGWEAMCELFPNVTTEPAIVVAGKEPTERQRAFDLLKNAPLPPAGIGSNNWAVAGRRSVTGKPLLANDPHLVAQMPSIWFECHLSAPGIEVSGVTLPVVVGIQIGHTARTAWGFTAVIGDNQDLYLERLNEEGSAAMYEGQWEPVTVHHEELWVRGRAEPEVLEVKETRHGPILDSYLLGLSPPEVIESGIRETYALRWAGMETNVDPGTMYRMATAGNIEEFLEALRGWTGPGLNMVYADVDGTIAYQCAGTYPIRRRGDGTVPVPGWTSEYEWDGYIPYDELPRCVNPEEGLLATSNQKIHDDSYPYLIGKDFFPPFRARRVVELLTATDRHSKETFGRIHSDTVSIPAREIVPHLLSMEPADERQKAALSYLMEWDADLAADSVAACIYQVWSGHIAREILLPKLGRKLFDHYYGRRPGTNTFQFQVLPNLLAYPSATWFGTDGRQGRDEALRRALTIALDELNATLGDDMAGWTWGSIHRARFVGLLGIMPDLTELFTGGEGPRGGDEQTVNQAAFEPGAGYDVAVVASWRQIVDLADIDASVGTHTTGQSGNPASPHYADLFPLWSKGEYHPLPFTRGAVEAATESKLTLSPQ